MNRIEWLKERKTGLGATDIASLVGVGFGTPSTVYADKTNPDVTDDKPHPLLSMGLALEDLNARLYCDRMGLTFGDDLVKPAKLIRHPEHSWAFASLDFQNVNEGRRPVETKYTIFFSDERWGEELTDQIPYGYIPQTHWQMDCVGAENADVPVLSGAGEHRIYRVTRDPGLASLLFDIGREFWFQFVLTATPPPDDWRHPATEEIVNRLMAVEKERQVVLEGEAAEVADEFVRLKEIIKEAELEADAKKLRLNALMDECGVPRPGKAIAGGVRLSRWLVEGGLVEPKPYMRQPYMGFRATTIKPKGK